ncbi:hypothetical protein LXJ58_34095, partial [Escherichia coli]|nr:hypothetical protein [Escherichia coli]
TGQDWQWFFDVYLYQATLPKLVANRNASQLTLKWQTPLNKPFPLPVEVQIDDRVQKVPMTGGLATITVPEGAHVVIDPLSRLLKLDDAVDAYQAWRAAQAPAAAKK